MIVDVMPKPLTQEKYLGDGLYATYDGYQVKLRAPREGSDHEVYLEPHVLASLIQYLKQCGFNVDIIELGA